MTRTVRQFLPLWRYVRPHVRAFVLGLSALVLASAFQLAAPLVLREAIDSLRGPSPGALLVRFSLAFLGLAFLQAVFKFLSRRAFLGAARRVEHDLRGAYFAHLIRLPAARIEAGRKGDFVSRATRDLQDVRLFLGTGALNFAQTLVLLVTATVLLWNIHPGLTATALAPFPVISILVRRYSPRLHRRYLKANEKAGDLSALVQEALSGTRVVRAYHREEWQIERFDKLNRALRDAEAQVVRAWALLFPMVGVVAGVGHIVVLGLGGALVANGHLTLGEFVAFNAYLAMLTWPMVALGWTLSLMQRGAAALHRLEDVLHWPRMPRGEARVPADATGACIEARDLGFAYEGAPSQVVSQVDISLPQGSFRGLVGPTAAGKSTLVDLLCGLRHPTRGSVTIHGRPISQVAPEERAAHVSAVPQDGFLFADTVAANVCLGRARDEERIAWALKVAELDKEVAGMPDGIESRVGEGGVTLSGGQRQRLALARAVYGKPQTLLLDSALSHLDAETARRVLQGLRTALPELTLLVVSHRGSEVDDADRVYFLCQGRIEAHGRHSELLERVPAYLRLYREEQLRRELAEAGT